MTDFYSNLADDYDGMTQFKSRLPKVRRSLGRYLECTSVRTALDVACGTGVCALALAEMGLEVVGTDPNSEMIAKAREHAVTLARTNVRFEVAFMQDDVPGVQRVDLITCIGNSLPHVAREDLLAVANRFRSTLNDGGKAVLQLKNFEKIVADGQRFIGASRQGDTELVRFYDLTENGVVFNLLRLTWEGGRARPQWSQTEMTPFTRDDLYGAFIAAGFSAVDFCGDLDGAPFDPKSSPDLVVVATA